MTAGRVPRDGLPYGPDGLGPFPRMSPKSVAAGRSYADLWDRWRPGPHVPLRVRGRMATGYLSGLDRALHLDGMLSGAVSGLQGPFVDMAAKFVLPLPLALAWIDPSGRPLWAATELRPVGSVVEGDLYIHSRYPTDRAPLARRQAALTAAGQFKDVRIPLRVTAAAAIEGWCLGIAEEVAMLLDRVTHVGRKPAHGRGRVVRWTVTPAPGIDLAWILERRTTPLAALGDAAVPARRVAPRIGWTPPYWDATFHAACRRAAWTS